MDGYYKKGEQTEGDQFKKVENLSKKRNKKSSKWQT